MTEQEHTMVRATLGDFYANTGAFLGSVRDRLQLLVLTRRGKPSIIIMPIEHYTRVLKDAEQWRRFERARHAGERIKDAERRGLL
jgi:PHD/YefM family antitoxin component YafN of YafNO toxin-antitoxin module